MQDRHIVITGSSSGVGRASAEALLESGAYVTGIARNHDKFQPNSKNYNPVTCNLQELKSLPKHLSDLLMSYPDINGLICNAGYGKFNGLESFSPSQIDSYINDNLTSHIIVTRALLPHFKTQNRGDIIFIGSEAALEGTRKGSLYCAAKFGLRGFSQAIRQESADKNIRVALINPGMIRTSFFDQLTFKPGDDPNNALEPEDISQIILNILSMRSGAVIDEINLTPLKKVVKFQ